VVFCTSALADDYEFWGVDGMVVDRYKVAKVLGPVDMAIEVDAGAIQMMVGKKTIQFILDVLEENINATSVLAIEDLKRASKDGDSTE
jgi:hypothetical protein